MTARLGIVGGGQLALYLCEAAQSLGSTVSVFADSSDSPAIAHADIGTVDSLEDEQALAHFLATCDVVTFDKEAIPDTTLEYLREASARGEVAIHPGVDTLALLKDKGLQKTWLRDRDLPTLPFHILDSQAFSLEELTTRLGTSLVQKSRVGGYDGRGVQIVRHPTSTAPFWDVPSIVEPFVENCHEISVVVVRDRSGQLEAFPPVDMGFDSQLNAVSVVSMPASISADSHHAAIELAQRTVTLLEGVGVFAVEMFITADDQLLINEISPRVHNSGHLTMDACNVSQFEQHARAVLGLPLLKIDCHGPAAAMLNILYTPDMREVCPATPTITRSSASDRVTYWYGKKPGAPGRKMGHINALADTPDAATRIAGAALADLTDNTRDAAG